MPFVSACRLDCLHRNEPISHGPTVPTMKNKYFCSAYWISQGHRKQSAIFVTCPKQRMPQTSKYVVRMRLGHSNHTSNTLSINVWDFQVCQIPFLRSRSSIVGCQTLQSCITPLMSAVQCCNMRSMFPSKVLLKKFSPSSLPTLNETESMHPSY